MENTDKKPLVGMNEEEMVSHKKHLIGMNEEDLVSLVRELGFRDFHGRQLHRWIYHKYAGTLDEMTDLPLSLRRTLGSSYRLDLFEPVRKAESSHGDAVKYVFRTLDDIEIENVVLVDSRGRRSFCISSQAGCSVGCIYCATGRAGFERDLSADEIVGEVLSLVKLSGRPQSILFMGMGEPLLNLKALFRSLSLLREIGYGSRHITVSTCGIVRGIRALADTDLRPRLALSLGSPIEAKRQRIIPAARSNPIGPLKNAIMDYRRRTGRRVTIEYTLMRGINDSYEDAQALAEFARSAGTHINLIEFNPAGDPEISAPVSGEVRRFRELLTESGVRVTQRYRRGRDISAACGQLVYSKKPL